MGAWEFIAGQLRSPSGAFGRHLMPEFVGFSVPAAIRRLPFTRHGFTLHEPDHLRRLLEDAGFGDVSMVPGTGRRGDYVCAIATQTAAAAD